MLTFCSSIDNYVYVFRATSQLYNAVKVIEVWNVVILYYYPVRVGARKG